MKKIYLLLVSVFLGGTLLTSCSDWNDDESVTINTPESPQYPAYLQSLRDYKNSDHKYVYAWFDNTEKSPSSRGQHMADVPDSIDVVVLAKPAQLVDFEISDMKSLQETKNTKVVYSVDFDQIKSEYEDMVKVELEKDEAYVPQEFTTYLKANLDNLFAGAEIYNYDGIIVGYQGQSMVYMSESEKATYLTEQNLFFNEVNAWMASNPSKMISYLGAPQFLNDKSILAKCKHIILNTLDVDAADKLGLYALQALVEGVPTDRFIVFVNTVSLDTTDKKTGYYGTNRAITEAAYWVTQGASNYTKSGIAINNVQADYYNSKKRYEYVRQSINIINPAPIN